MIATLSARVVRLSDWPGVRAFPVPIEFPSFRETMLWHRRNDNDPAHGWLRGLILDASETIGDSITSQSRASARSSQPDK
jgi:LysR family transcriptional regulator, mexEF-oprN operon transcriptional activator